MEKVAEAAVSSSFGNEPFTMEEQKYLAAQLDEIKGYVTTTNKLHGEQQERLDEMID
jgi:hypothetical protein